MQKKTTTNLENELKRSDSIDSYLKNNEEEMATDSLAAQLQALIKSKGMIRADVVKECSVNEIYAYQILSGARRPSRDKLISMCFAMKATLEETQSLLKRNGFAPLYARISRDSFIIFALSHNQTIIQLNQSLYDHSEPLVE